MKDRQNSLKENTLSELCAIKHRVDIIVKENKQKLMDVFRLQQATIEEEIRRRTAGAPYADEGRE